MKGLTTNPGTLASGAPRLIDAVKPVCAKLVQEQQGQTTFELLIGIPQLPETILQHIVEQDVDVISTIHATHRKPGTFLITCICKPTLSIGKE